MIKYLTTHQTEAAYQAFLNSLDCPYINVSHIVATDENKYYKESSVLQNTPFTITIDKLSDNRTLELSWVGHRTTEEIPTYFKYKINNGDWQTYNYNLNQYEIGRRIYGVTVKEGDTLQIINKSNGFKRLFCDDDLGDLECTVSGNVMSLVWGDDFVYAPANKVPYPGKTYNDDLVYGGKELIHFAQIIENHRITDASDLWLPTKNLGEHIFDEMFSEGVERNEYLEAAPDINAKYVPDSACKNMFRNCTVLEDMPNILAETVEAHAFEEMFVNCTSLVNTTELHVKHIVAYADWGGHPMMLMFANCTSLVTAPAWDATFDCVIPESHVNAANTLRWNSSFWGMFMHCTNLTSCPWHIKTLNLNFNADSNDLCQMFGNEGSGACNALTTIPTFETEVKGNFNFPTNFMQDKDQNLITSITFIGYEQVNSGGQVTGLDYSGNGTIYLDSSSPYLPGGEYENDYPLGLTNWTKSVYTPNN